MISYRAIRFFSENIDKCWLTKPLLTSFSPTLSGTEAFVPIEQRTKRWRQAVIKLLLRIEMHKESSPAALKSVNQIYYDFPTPQGELS